MNNDKPKTPEELDDEKYSAKDYFKKVFEFSQKELEELKPLEDVSALINTLMSIGMITQRAKDGYVASQVIKRLGTKDSPDTKFSYDIPGKRVIVYEPRFWCSICNNKKAEFQYEKKLYCQTCIEQVKEKMAKKIEPAKEEKTEKKKV